MSKTVTRRGQSKPPKNLKVLISVANHRPLPEAKVLFDGPGKHSRICALLKSISKAERAFLGSPDNELQFRRQYDAFLTAQEYLPVIADQNSGSEDRADYDVNDQFTSLPSIRMSLYVHNGKFGASGNFFNAIEDVEAHRIRRCAICPKIFWAVRVTSRCCSRTHRKSWNKRNSRRASKNRTVARASKMKRDFA